ncbi:MAG TPA: AAA family ATPase [Ignavibacteria bacterium]|nr:AAA family ATPase [Ignavibacteria bacterium]
MSDNYKFKELKTYAEDEWLFGSTKKYRTVFEEKTVTYIDAELSLYNKKFDEEDWKLTVNLKAFDSKGVMLCDLPVTKDVLKTENIIFIRNGWGNKNPGAFWKRGSYRWEAWIDGQVIGSKNFYIENQGIVTKTHNPYFRIKSLKLYESGNEAADKITYLKTFDFAKTRFIYFEFIAENLVKDKDWWACEIFFNFETDLNELKGQDTQFRVINKSDKELFFTGGWGNAKGGSWFKGTYFLDIVFMEEIVARLPFKIDTHDEEAGESYYQDALNEPVETAKELETKSSPESPTYEEAIKELNELIGLESIKKKISEYADYIKFLKLKEQKGLSGKDKIQLHSVFTGNPGTGKTKVANLLGKIYKSLGLLSKGHVHEVDREMLVGEYIGHTAPKVKDAINQARGGILFIDEAYSLARSGEDSRDYGKEVIEILIKEMSDGPGDIAIIVAGYPKEMELFLNSNPGLKSRFNMYFNFPDYTPDELMSIADYYMSKSGNQITPDAKAFLLKEVIDAYRDRDRTFGNARYVNGIIEEAKMKMGLRIVKEGDVSNLKSEEFTTITLQDIQSVFNQRKSKPVDIPIDEELLRDALAKLNNLIGLENIKQEVNEIVKLVRYYREAGRDVKNLISLHSVFMGNPGTGKTTVARILADLYKALGILEKGHLVEVDRSGLVAGYVGQTAIKTTEVINRAMGGVLFIDEAYALSSGRGNDFGEEAIETILKQMEDRRGDFIVIVAGYTNEMAYFIESNPGLKSRFDKVFLFRDYNAEELFIIAENIFKQEGHYMDEQAAAHLKEYLKSLDAVRDEHFGNGREVRKIVEEAIKNHHIRIVDIPKEQRTEETYKKITLSDVDEFVPIVVQGKPKMGFSV